MSAQIGIQVVIVSAEARLMRLYAYDALHLLSADSLLSENTLDLIANLVHHVLQ